jgi:signal transduction histidine kinase
MIAGEAFVFIIILTVGVIYVIRSYRKELFLSSRHKNFTLSITHELKTPIASSKLFAQTLIKKELTKDKQKEVLSKIVEDQNRLQKLVDNILLASKIDESNIKLNKEKIYVYNFINDICLNISKNDNFCIDINKDLYFNVDVFYFTSVVQNLFENAIKYSSADSKIIWKAELLSGKIIISISDEGKGISENEKLNIFKMFYRAETEETRKTKGTGLGLYLVYSIVKLHNGEISVKDNLPIGTKFIITLPKNG